MPDYLRLAAALDDEGFHCAADLARLRQHDCRASIVRELASAATWCGSDALAQLTVAVESWGSDAFEADFAAYLARKAAAR